MNHKAVYTIITNHYDQLRAPAVRSEGYDYICFTDDPELTSDFWDIRLIDKSDDPVKQQREIKILPHKFLPEYKITVYTDASQQLLRNVDALRFTGGMILKRHPSRNCIYQEAERVVSLGKDSRENIAPQMASYSISGHPNHWGLYETGFMVRENCDEVNGIMDLWWLEVEKGSHRDQISLPVVIARCGYAPRTVDARTINTYFRSFKHNISRKETSDRVWYSTPFSPEKNIGKAYNEFCEMVPDDDWICLRDGDSMFMTSDWGQQISDIIRIHGNNYDLLGCVTNRLNSECQRPFPEDFDKSDILYHKQVADRLHDEHYSDVKSHDRPVAGLLMLFPKRVWKDVKFREKSIYFDSEFGKDLLKKGGRIGLMSGLYVLHFYRWDKENPRTYKNHLMV